MPPGDPRLGTLSCVPRGWYLGGSAGIETCACVLPTRTSAPWRFALHPSCSYPAPFLTSSILIVSVSASYRGLSHGCLHASFSLEPPVLICRYLQGMSIQMSCLCLRFLSHPECHSFLPKLASLDRSIPGGPDGSPSSRHGSDPAILLHCPPLLAQPSLSRSWPFYLTV